MNYLYGVEIKMTPDKGRGVFASRPLKKGELLVVENAVAETFPDDYPAGGAANPAKYESKRYQINSAQTELVTKCSNLMKLKGIQGLRISYLYDGSKMRNLRVPPIDIFYKNNYKGHP